MLLSLVPLSDLASQQGNHRASQQLARPLYLCGKVVVDAKPMKNAPGQDKEMKDGMIEIVIAYKERHSTRVAKASKYQQVHGGLRQDSDQLR